MYSWRGSFWCFVFISTKLLVVVQYHAWIWWSISLRFSGQHVPSKNKENSDVGVVSNVAIYSLKAKVGKLEAETQRLNEKVQQVEKEKVTLSLMNTESR